MLNRIVTSATDKEMDNHKGYPYMNGSHRVRSYFEWWYLHVVAEEGLTFNVVLHETDIFGRELEPYVSLTCHRPQQASRYVWRSLSPWSIGTSGSRPSYLYVAPSLWWEEAGRMVMDVDFAGGNRLVGEVERLSPPLAMEEGVLYRDPMTGGSSYWVVNMPLARFTGILHLDGVPYVLRGMAYQDHQWGNLCIQSFVSDWVWGHFSNEEMSVIFFEVLTQRGQRIQRIAITMCDSQLVGRCLESGFLPAMAKREEPQTLARSFTVHHSGYGEVLSFVVGEVGVMKCRQGERVEGQLGTYVRWSAEGRSPLTSQPLRGVTEYMRFRPAPAGSC